MKKLLLGLAVATLGLSTAGSSAGATNECTISNTGANSSNSCVIKDDFTCKAETNNKFTVVNKNNQEAISGDAKVSGNTNAGSATTGSATNSNGTVIDVSIDNSGACAVTAVTPPATVVPGSGAGGDQPSGGQQPVGGAGAAATPAAPQPAPTVGGMGAIAPVAAPQKTAPTVLPYTSAASTAGVITAIMTVLGATIVGSRIAINAYNKTQLQ